jgi:hypothetical protein
MMCAEIIWSVWLSDRSNETKLLSRRCPILCTARLGTANKAQVRGARVDDLRQALLIVFAFDGSGSSFV